MFRARAPFLESVGEPPGAPTILPLTDEPEAGQ